MVVGGCLCSDVINFRLETVIITSLNVCGWAVGKLLVSVVLCHNNFFYVGRRFFDCVHDEVDLRYSVIINVLCFLIGILGEGERWIGNHKNAWMHS